VSQAGHLFGTLMNADEEQSDNVSFALRGPRTISFKKEKLTREN
jgi:hypothetical protein